METVFDRAIILNRKSFGEADVMLTVLTENHGKLRVLAKGARRPSSRLVGHTELFSVIYGQINLRSRIPILSQVTVEHSVRGLAEDAATLQRIAVLAETTDKALEEGEAHETIFRLLVDGSLGLRDTDMRPALFVGLLIRLLGLLGYAPDMGSCVVCRQALRSGGEYGFHYELGGIVADGCLHGVVMEIPRFTTEELKALRFLQRQPIAAMGRLEAPSVMIDRLSTILIEYAHYVLEQPILAARPIFVTA